MANSLTTSQPIGQGFLIQTSNAGFISFIVDVGGAGGVTSVYGRTGAVVAQNNDYSASQINWTAIALGQQVVRHGSSVEGIGSLSADLVAASVARTPSTDKVCTFWLADPVAANPALTLNNSTLALLSVSLIVRASTGAGRWSVLSQDGSTAWTQPDNGAWLVDLQWSAATSVWVVSAVKPNQ